MSYRDDALANISEQDAQNFWARVLKAPSCWIWLLSKNHKGYGEYGFRGVTVACHRFSWVLANGPIPPDLQIDHICRVRHCVNPDHLRLLRPEQNALLSPKHNAFKAYCPAGHPYTPGNTYLKRRSNGFERVCKLCKSASERRRTGR